jgi:hypothetical protein
LPLKGADFDQIYTGAGLGFKTGLADRIVLQLKESTIRYNFNAGENLLTRKIRKPTLVS